jgi:hypothetical protein
MARRQRGKRELALQRMDRRALLRVGLTSLLAFSGAEVLDYRPVLAQTTGPPSSARESAEAAIEYLRSVMDQFHTRLAVYDDISSAGNHFHGRAKIPDGSAAVAINGSSDVNPHSGATAIRCVLRNTTGSNFGGFYFLNSVLPAGSSQPVLNFGTVASAGVNLVGARELTSWARGEQGGEVVEFFVGGVGRNPDNGRPTAPYPDSTPVVKLVLTLTNRWDRYRIDLRGRDLRYVLGGFGWGANALENRNGAVFYLDDIEYGLTQVRRSQRLAEPRFLQSFSTDPVQPDPDDSNKDDDFDLVLRNIAYTYDNALALLAFLAQGGLESLDRAMLIGDAFVYASLNDRFFDDGRLRDAYTAGDLALPSGWTPNNRLRTVPVPGFYHEPTDRFVEVEQAGISVGNNAWAMIALLALYRRTHISAYLLVARRIGEFIRRFRNDAGRYRGFQGGLDNPEAPNVARRAWASTEHNLDVYAAFTVMSQLTGETDWARDAENARQFVEDMWDPQRGCYLTGTLDPSTRNQNQGQLPVDAQAWAMLALTNTLTLHPQLLDGAELNHRTSHDGFLGFDFNEDKDGVWFEGTAQMAVAYAIANRPVLAEGLRQELRRAQRTPQFGDNHGIVAASHDGVSTGFGFKLFRRRHVAATAWHIFAQLQFNPYYQTGVP